MTSSFFPKDELSVIWRHYVFSRDELSVKWSNDSILPKTHLSIKWWRHNIAHRPMLQHIVHQFPAGDVTSSSFVHQIEITHHTVSAAVKTRRCRQSVRPLSIMGRTGSSVAPFNLSAVPPLRICICRMGRYIFLLLRSAQYIANYLPGHGMTSS